MELKKMAAINRMYAREALATYEHTGRISALNAAELNGACAEEKEKLAAEEDARLIAAAPDLLAAARETLRQLNASDCPSIPDGAMVRGRLVSAIARAEGGAR